MAQSRVLLTGNLYSHHYDLVIGNGTPVFAGQALSLQVPDQRDAEKDIDAIGWALQDLRDRAPQLDAGILTLIPTVGVEC